MFSLNKSLAKLRAALVEEGLAENAVANDNGKAEKKSKVKPRKPKTTENDNPKPIDSTKSNVVMIRNFPHGFYEKQMFSYFSQFGQVTRLKIVRSRKTGQPRNYGFIEFKYADVAKIAADTMNNYLMFNHIVKCQVLPKQNVRKDLFRNWNRPFISTVKKHKELHNQTKTVSVEYNLLRKRLKRIHHMQDQLKPLGIQFDVVTINRPVDLKSRIQSSASLYCPKLVIPTHKRRKLVVWKYVKLRAAARRSNLVRFD